MAAADWRREALGLSLADVHERALFYRELEEYRLQPDSTDGIQMAVAAFFRVSLKDLLAKKRGGQHVSLARMVAMYLTRERTGKSFPDMGACFGRDHSTVIHACNLVAKRIARDRAFKLTIDRLTESIAAAPTSQSGGVSAAEAHHAA